MTFGTLPLQDDAGLRLQIGPLRLDLWRRGERVSVSVDRDPGCEEESCEPLSEPPQVERVFVVDGPLTLQPVLPDRALVARPEFQLTLASGGRCEVWVGVPLWVRLDPIIELPCLLPKSTWFGPSMVDGELCYASRTRLRESSDFPMGPHRALCQVVVRNKAKQPLVIDRLRLPLRRLALIERDGRLFTEGLDLCSEDDDDAVLGTAKRLPVEGRVVTPAREVHADGPLRVFNAIIPRWW